MPRAADAHSEQRKWHFWILAPRGHGSDWTRVFHVAHDDSGAIWTAISEAVLDAPVSTIRDRAPHGVVCGVELTLTINDRTASVATSWHFSDEDAAPRLVTAYPKP